MNFRNYTILGSLLLVALLVCPEMIEACPNCKSGFTEGTTQASVGEAYSTTIYMLLVLPALIVGLIATKIVRSARQHTQNTISE